jgi:hypothetical protein
VKPLGLFILAAPLLFQSTARGQNNGVIFHDPQVKAGATPLYYPHGPNQTRQPVTSHDVVVGELKTMIASPDPISVSVPLLHRMGDGLAREVLAIAVARAPLTATEQMRVLDMVHQSFEKPAAIHTRSDVATQSTLALLQQLTALQHDFTVSVRIADTTDFVFAQVAQAQTAK